MCGVYHIDEDNAELIRILSTISGLTVSQTGDIFPGDVAPVLTNERPAAMRWGFSLEGVKRRVINAKSETVLVKPLFYELVLKTRCAVPASCYYEWETLTATRKKYAIKAENDSPVYIAGLFRRTKSGLPEFVILTRRPENNISFIHDRMPLLLTDDACDEWLFGADAARLLENAADLSPKVRYSAL